MVNILDDVGGMQELDMDRMLEYLRQFPENCRLALELAEKVPLDDIAARSFNAVVFVGIGGSAIGGAFVKDWLNEESRIPLAVSRGQSVPSFVDGETLVFAVSYSGNTLETRAACVEAFDKGATVVVLTSGGDIGRLAKERGLVLLRMPEGMKPRAAIPFQFFMLAATLNRLGLIPDSWGEVDEAIRVLESLRDEMVPEVASKSNPAKRLAEELLHRIPFIYGPKLLESVSYRFSTQLMENAKTPAASWAFPEAFHNAVMTSEAHQEILDHLSLLIIRDPQASEETKRKVRRFEELFGPKVGALCNVEARGNGKLARMLSVVYWGDFVSTYLALLYGRDPGSTDAIDEMKRV
ncbi:MAG: bifunctional phosphoglucose/phosphomannose isomerase [Candidatus Bathyarchaeota archaeon]|nr:MAG: bifunctional phosphoglucose/phosphomannose isomerase [Candidatus Bathyarchaeota archaeon]